MRTLSLQEMMSSKIETFLSRREIRDVFDIEFLLKKGIELKVSKEELERLLDGINSLSKKDYSVKLGSILAEAHSFYMPIGNLRF